MTTTVFVNGVTLTDADWFNDTDQVVYDSDGADYVSFLQSGTGATTRTVQAKGRDVVSVKDFGAVGDGSTDDTAAIQAAINTGKDIDFVGLNYKANGLTQSTNSQCLFSSQGVSQITKNANGVLFTSTGDDVQCTSISFRGDASSPTFTGDNVNASGANFAMLNCGSRWTSGRAVKATGGHVQILGTCDVYQTTDTTANGYDIEIGVSGTATLYHQVHGVYTSQTTGGIKLIDTGSAVLCGGQLGKLYIAAGTSPAGVNGGNIIGLRINGITTVEVSDAVLSCNIFNDNVTFSAATSNCRFDGSNILASGKTVTNSGTQNMIVNGNNDGLQEVTGRILVFPNNSAMRWRKADGTAAAGATMQMVMSVGNNFSLENNVTDGAISYLTHGTSDFQNFLVNGGTEVYRINGTQGFLISRRISEKQGAVLTAANNLTLGTDGNYFQVDGATQINLILNTNWQGGSVVTLKFNSTPTVKHNQAASGNNKPIMLVGGDFVASASDTLTLRYDSTDAAWYEMSRSVI